MRRLKRSDITLEDPLPWSIFDSKGTLLLRAGTRLSLSTHVDTLIERGIYAAIPETENAPAAPRVTATNVFHELTAIPLKLKPIINALLSSDAGEDVPERIDFFTQSILNLCAQDVNAALASVHVNSHAGYLLSHLIHTAVITALVGRESGIDKTTLSALVKAAITLDLAMFLNAHLEKITGEIENELLGSISDHPAVARQFLALAGIEDPIWLDAVLHHHERLDGSGYPDGLRGAQISQGAALLGLADSYASAIKNRPYRRSQTPRAALATLLNDRRYDSDLARHLATTVTAYPPGSLVKLANGEVAVINARPRKQTGHIATPVFSVLGVPILRHVERDTQLAPYAIQQAVSDDDYRAAEIVIRRVWNKT